MSEILLDREHDYLSLLKMESSSFTARKAALIIIVVGVVGYVAGAIWINADLCDRTHTPEEFAKLVTHRYTATKVGRAAIVSSRGSFAGDVTRWKIFGIEGQEVAEVTMRRFFGFGLQELVFESREGRMSTSSPEAAGSKK